MFMCIPDITGFLQILKQMYQDFQKIIDRCFSDIAVKSTEVNTSITELFFCTERRC